MDKRAIFNAVVLYYRIGDVVNGKSALSVEWTIECMNDSKNVLLELGSIDKLEESLAASEKKVAALM